MEKWKVYMEYRGDKVVYSVGRPEKVYTDKGCLITQIEYAEGCNYISDKEKAIRKRDELNKEHR